METNEIKKVLYKEKPIANYFGAKENSFLYSARTSIGQIWFEVPKEESGNFKLEEPAQLLIRWIKN